MITARDSFVILHLPLLGLAPWALIVFNHAIRFNGWSRVLHLHGSFHRNYNALCELKMVTKVYGYTYNFPFSFLLSYSRKKLIFTTQMQASWCCRHEVFKTLLVERYCNVRRVVGTCIIQPKKKSSICVVFTVKCWYEKLPILAGCKNRVVCLLFLPHLQPHWSGKWSNCV